ncbi:MAG TPA: tetratricopeptide repeat protein, partial [Lacipirellulaceae bacterium]
TRPELRSLGGLYRIWFDLGATQQYYPLLHSAFWFEHLLWGDEPLGYHLTNLLLHCGVVCLVYAVLRRLRIPGALLAAAIFAVHPVEVESVAWITEQKNTLSALFYLSAMLAYLRFDETRKPSSYWLAFALFLLGLLAKTVTATLPAALLVIFWWQRGKLDWRNDFRPFVPFFIVGAAAGILTAWVERKLIGAQGAEFELSFLERGLIAGRAIWFYFGKLAWPVELTFIYPRWNVDTAIWWQWLFPLAAVAVLAGLVVVRRWWRAPLAGWLFFVGTLFPVLGFLNVFPFIYSFVADHFQYLAGLGIIVLFASGATLVMRRLPDRAQSLGKLASLVLVATLALLTWQQSGMYSDLDTLYQTTIARNPNCWMAYNNLGVHFAKDKLDDAAAIKFYRQSLALKPDFADSHYNLANALVRVGNREDAMAEFNQALDLKPNFAEAENNLGNLLRGMGQTQEAIAHLARAAAMEPHDLEIQSNLESALLAAGDFDRAIEQGRIAIRLDPDIAESHHNLGVAMARAGQNLAAVHEFQETIRLDPEHADAYGNLAKTYAALDRPQEAIATAKSALELARSYGEEESARQIEAWLTKYRMQQSQGGPSSQPAPSQKEIAKPPG